MPCLHQTGVVRVETIEELFDVGDPGASAGAHRRRVTIVGNAGGLASGATLHQSRLEVPELSAGSSQFRQPSAAGRSVRNPINLAASATSKANYEGLRRLAR